MDAIIDQIYFSKKITENWKNLSLSNKEKAAYELFDESLTPEQRKLLRIYEQYHCLRLENLHKEIFTSGFSAGSNKDLEILKATLKRF